MANHYGFFAPRPYKYPGGTNSESDLAKPLTAEARELAKREKEMIYASLKDSDQKISYKNALALITQAHPAFKM